MKKTTWHKVKAPKPWKPKAGDELIGSYLGCKTKAGQFGEYLVHYVQSRGQVYYASGCVANDLFSLVCVNDKVKLVFNGTKAPAVGKEHGVKLFELYTEEEVYLKLAETA